MKKYQITINYHDDNSGIYVLTAKSNCDRMVFEKACGQKNKEKKRK